MKRVFQLLALLAALVVPLTVTPPPAAVQASVRPRLVSAPARSLDAVNCAVTPTKTSLSSDEQAFLTLLNAFRASGDPAGSTPPPGAKTAPLGLPAAGPVQLDNRLVQSSAWFSQDHAQNGYQTTDPTGHNNPDHVDSLGRYIDKRLADCDFPTAPGSATTDYRENVYFAYPPSFSGASAQGALAGWYDLCDGDANGNNCTYQHRKAMLDPNATVVGIARVDGPKGGPGEPAGQQTAHWTLDLGNPGAGNIVAFPGQPPAPSPANPVPGAACSPTVTSVSPSSAPATGGTLVTITGTCFTGATAVTFGGPGRPATSFSFISDTQVSAVTPPFPFTVDGGQPLPADGYTLPVQVCIGTSCSSGGTTNFAYLPPSGGSQPPAPQPSAYHDPTIIDGWPQLSSLTQGEAVTSLQYLLQAHGATLTVDGKFGPQTDAAVRAFQQAQGLTVDGIVGPQTWQALIVYTQQGDEGPAVRAVQSQLASRGVDIVVDGDFGPLTDAAVRAYQRSRSLEIDGEVGPQTWQALLVGK